MSLHSHETPAFQHAAEFTIAVTFVVAGGKRLRTANQRAQRIFEQIANYAAQRARKEADRQRRLAVRCHNAHPSVLDGSCRCRRVYCAPQTHLLALRAARRGEHNPFCETRCLCGQAVAMAGQRCHNHQDHRRRRARRRPRRPPTAARSHDLPMTGS